VCWALLMSAIDITEVVIVLNSDEAVKAFSRGGNVTVGGGSRRGRGEVEARPRLVEATRISADLA
jgi:lipid-binding SYLF domain-containing protein